MLAVISQGHQDFADVCFLVALVLFLVTTVAASGRAAVLTSYALALGWLGLAFLALGWLVL